MILYGTSTWIIQYQFILQFTVESSSSQTECFSLPIHSESCNMRLCYCVTADYCSHPCPDGRRTAWQRSNLHETARKRPTCAPAVGFNSESFGSATRTRDTDMDWCQPSSLGATPSPSSLGASPSSLGATPSPSSFGASPAAYAFLALSLCKL